MRDHVSRICLMSYVLTAASIAWGHIEGPEYIESFDTTLEIRESGALDVAHVIDVHPHGEAIRRGLYFALPEHIGPLADVSATLGGRAVEPEFDDGAITVAAAEPLERHESHRFEVRYLAGSPWWLASTGTARLRWEPIIEQFELAWRDARLTLRWPDSMAPPILPDAGTRDGDQWTLRLQSPASRTAERVGVGRLEFRADGAALSPSSMRRYGADWRWRMLLGGAIVALLGLLHWMWRAVGRDGDTDSAPPRAAAPEGISPAAARFLDRMGFDATTFVTALLSLRVKQALDIQLDESGARLGLTRRQGGGKSLSRGEREIMNVLFDGADAVELDPNGERGAKAAGRLQSALGEEHRGRHFLTNRRHGILGIAAGMTVFALGLCGLILQARDHLTPDPWVIGLGVAALIASVVSPLIYFDLFKAPTRAGIGVKRQIAGLKRYLADSATVRDADHFIELLPYAVALDAETRWRDRFAGHDVTGADGDAADVLAWYREVQRSHGTAAAMVPVIAAASGATVASSAGAGGGASAGGV